MSVAYKAGKVLNAVMYRVPALSSCDVSEADRDWPNTISDFLATAGNITKGSSGRNYVSLSLSVMAFRLLIQRCELFAGKIEYILQPIASEMLGNLDQYTLSVMCRAAILAKIIDPRFEHNVFKDDKMLRRNVATQICRDGEYAAGSSGEQLAESPTCGSRPVKYLMGFVLEQERGPIVEPYDEVARFLSTTSVEDRHIDILE